MGIGYFNRLQDRPRLHSRCLVMGYCDSNDGSDELGDRRSPSHHSVNTDPRTMGNFSSEAISQRPEASESPLCLLPVSSFLRTHRCRNVLSDRLELPSGPHIFLARPEGQHCYSPSKQNPKFSRTKSGVEKLQTQHQFIITISNISSSYKTIDMNKN